jgi:hypothetical protein
VDARVSLERLEADGTVEWAQGGGKSLSPFEASCYRMTQVILALVAVAEQAQVLTSGIRRWNEEVQGVIGRQPDYRWPALDEAESALAELEAL